MRYPVIREYTEKHIAKQSQAEGLGLRVYPYSKARQVTNVELPAIAVIFSSNNAQDRSRLGQHRHRKLVIVLCYTIKMKIKLPKLEDDILEVELPSGEVLALKLKSISAEQASKNGEAVRELEKARVSGSLSYVRV